MAIRPSYELEAAKADNLPRIVEMKLLMFAEAGHEALLSPNARHLILNDYEFSMRALRRNTLSRVPAAESSLARVHS
jgi:hypothetical protein